MFTKRTSKPQAGNKSYIRKASGGWNSCITGYPTDKDCNVLANCVGYANGRFNEIITELTGYQGNKFNTLNCNAENFIERAKAAGLQIGQTPKPGSIACWQKGTLASSDGAGHVAVVETVYDNNHIYTSESGYGQSAFWNQHRYNNNGRWGIGSSYTFRGFIYNPEVKDLPPITPSVDRNIYHNQLETNATMNVRTGAGTKNDSLGTVTSGKIYDWYETSNDGTYTWYRIADSQWVAQDKESTYLKIYNAEPKPTPTRKYKVGDVVSFTGVLYADVNGNGAGQSRTNLKATISIVHEAECSKPYNINSGLGWVAEEDLSPYSEPTLNIGDKVVIKAAGNGDSYGTSKAAYGIGWTRTILNIYSNRPFPYQVGTPGKGTTGFYKAEALEKK